MVRMIKDDIIIREAATEVSAFLSDLPQSSRATPIAIFIGRPARCMAQPFFARRIMPAGRPWEACRVD
ncbi:MAG: hypothetical protein AW07_03443 [Candidatus Accumulibacter sp. SK-11]|nr:MAG: hypothetical protein AW07_03443 [Candidatus Accumulibacter sp. SK-11]